MCIWYPTCLSSNNPLEVTNLNPLMPASRWSCVLPPCRMVQWYPSSSICLRAESRSGCDVGDNEDGDEGRMIQRVH